MKSLISIFISLLILFSCSSKKIENEINVENYIPGYMIQVYKNGNMVDQIIKGNRVFDNDKFPISENDLWHLGSCSKSFTSYLIYQLIKQNKINYKSKIEKFFPDMNRSNIELTIEDLLTHESGILNIDDSEGSKTASIYKNAYKFEIESNSSVNKASLMLKSRYEAAQSLLKIPIDKSKLKIFNYSNSNYIILGAIVESVFKKDYFSALNEQVFRPLNMNSCRLGLPNKLSKNINNPEGHQISFKNKKFKVTHIEEKNNEDVLPLIMAPAGLMSCSMSDWGKFIKHLNAIYLNKPKSTVDSKYFSFSHDNYYFRAAFGSIDKINNLNGPFYLHAGSNGIFTSIILWNPNKEEFILAASNTADKNEDENTPNYSENYLKDKLSEQWLKNFQNK
jgi:CubicO group peptidase (beta-lactamase class C family)